MLGGLPYAGLPPSPPSPTKEGGGKKTKGSDKDKEKSAEREGGGSPDNQSHRLVKQLISQLVKCSVS